MKIIILGAGQVGSSVAASLCSEANDITIIDRNPTVLRNLQERFDLQTINGSASHPSVLDQAGARDADMIIAVTNSDETNMIACQVAYTVFHTPTKIARVRNHEYLKSKQLFAQEATPIDVLISPEQLVTEHSQWARAAGDHRPHGRGPVRKQQILIGDGVGDHLAIDARQDFLDFLQGKRASAARGNRLILALTRASPGSASPSSAKTAKCR